MNVIKNRAAGLLLALALLLGMAVMPARADPSAVTSYTELVAAMNSSASTVTVDAANFTWPEESINISVTREMLITGASTFTIPANVHMEISPHENGSNGCLRFENGAIILEGSIRTGADTFLLGDLLMKPGSSLLGTAYLPAGYTWTVEQGAILGGSGNSLLYLGGTLRGTKATIAEPVRVSAGYTDNQQPRLAGTMSLTSELTVRTDSEKIELNVEEGSSVYVERLNLDPLGNSADITLSIDGLMTLAGGKTHSADGTIQLSSDGVLDISGSNLSYNRKPGMITGTGTLSEDNTGTARIFGKTFAEIEGNRAEYANLVAPSVKLESGSIPQPKPTPAPTPTPAVSPTPTPTTSVPTPAPSPAAPADTAETPPPEGALVPLLPEEVPQPTSTPVPSAASDIVFSDVSGSDWFYEPVQWAVANEITNGTGNNRFSPEITCTRAHILTFLWRALGQPEPTIANPFGDVNVSIYYAKPAVWAYEHGLVTGAAFEPDTACTRASTVWYIWKALGAPASTAAAAFNDLSDPQYTAAINWAVENGITNGTGGGKFEPDTVCNRGHIVTFLYRAFHSQETPAPLPSAAPSPAQPAVTSTPAPTPTPVPSAAPAAVSPVATEILSIAASPSTAGELSCSVKAAQGVKVSNVFASSNAVRSTGGEASILLGVTVNTPDEAHYIEFYEAFALTGSEATAHLGSLSAALSARSLALRGGTAVPPKTLWNTPFAYTAAFDYHSAYRGNADSICFVFFVYDTDYSPVGYIVLETGIPK